MEAREAVIVDTVRTPIGKRKGALAGWHPTDLLGFTMRGLLERVDADPGLVDDVVGGCVTQSGEQGCNVTRNAWVAAGLPWHVPATSVDRQCGSSQQAAHFDDMIETLRDPAGYAVWLVPVVSARVG